MKKSLFTVTIGIPAYNEEANINNLLLSLIDQKQDGFVLKEILVVSDGSTDRTAKQTQSVKSKIITLVNCKKRKGKAFRQNQIVKCFKGDILVILDADVLPKNKYLIKNLVLPIIQNKADLVGGKRIPLPAASFFEKIINFSAEWKSTFFEKVNKGNTVYLCNGCVHAFSSRLCKQLRWPDTLGEDAYSYFFCIKNNFRFFYQKTAEVLYRSPTNLSDHQKQSIRFLHSQKKMAQYFGKDFVSKHYKINLFRALKAILISLVQKPTILLSFLAIYVYTKVASKFQPEKDNLWELSTSSKRLI